MLAYSVIIPIYNAEKYLESCVQSVLLQKTESEYEIILVNDGSRDSSPELCERLARQDGRIRVIHQVNQGVSAARNAGIVAAQGEYILFLDSDDCWDADLLTRLDMYIDRSPDLVEFGYLTFGEETEGDRILPEPVSGDSGKASLDACIRKGVMPMGSACVAAFRRAFLNENGLRFATGVRYGEDLEFKVHCLLHVETMYSIQTALYRYRMHQESAVHTLSLEKIRDVLSVCVRLYRLYPNPVFANYYCINILKLADLTRKDAAQLKDFLKENSDILQHVAGKKSLIACALYKIFGWRLASKLILTGVELRQHLK